MESSEAGGAAFPSMLADEYGSNFANEGMTLRQYAAIKLKVPNSGTNWLDAVIEKSLRDDLAAKAMQGFVMDEALHKEASTAPEWLKSIADASYELADAVLKARKGGAA